MLRNDRRTFLSRSLTGLVAGLTIRADRLMAATAPLAQRKFTLDLSPGAIGVNANQLQAIELAAKAGFESVFADAHFLATLDDARREELKQLMQKHQISWGAAGLPVDFRRDESRFQEDLKKLPTLARAMQKANVTRVGTWLRPYHESLTYTANFRQHARRLRACCRILMDFGLRFGMEYVGPKTLWTSGKHAFIHTMAETKELIGEIGLPNVGFVLDSWHWYTAHETVDDLLSLKNSDIVACDLNDAPRGIPVDEQIDSRRELPATTGVIDLKAFLTALATIGYDGPVRAEPFNATLNAMDNEAACKATADALRRACAHLTSPGGN